MSNSTPRNPERKAPLKSFEQEQCQHEHGGKRQRSSDGSSLSSFLNPHKKHNIEIESESPSPFVEDPFSPSASELIDTKFEELIINTMTTDSFVQDLIKSMVDKAVKQRTLQQEQQICFLQGMVDSLTLKVNQLEEAAEQQKNMSDHLEQYSRRHSPRIVNTCPEETNEDTDQKVIQIVKEGLNIDISKCEIDRSHRVGRPTSDRPRPIITKFISYKTKASIYNARNRLKFTGDGSRSRGVYINEDLTKTRLSMFKRSLKLKRDNLITETWTTDGNIFVKDRTLRTKMFTIPEDFYKWELQLRTNPPLLYSQTVDRQEFSA